MAKQTQSKIAKWEQADARAMAVRALERVSNGAYSNLQLNALIKQSELAPRDVNLMTTMVYGVIQHRLTLEFWLKPFIKQPNKLDPWVRELLMVSLFQMVYLDKVPNHAIFDQAITIAKKRGHDGTRRMVTGVLHAIDRQGVSSTDTIKDPVERLSVEASMPVWLLNALIADYGMDRTTSLVATLNQAPHQSVRVNTAVTTVAQAIEDLEADGFTVTPSPLSPVGLLVQGGHVASSWLFEHGDITLQDDAAMLMAPSLQIEPGDQVLDAAAAPGGKTTQIATYLDPAQGGKVTALDIHAHKVKLIAENAARLQVAEQVDAYELDARKVDDVFKDGQFDRILVDAPCSGLGLLRRKPEIRYEKTLADAQNLQKIQLAILDAVAAKLRVGGRLVYGTCTMLSIENKDVVNQFLANHADFELVPTVLEKADLALQDASGMVQVLPDQFDSDGFFIATLVKKG